MRLDSLKANEIDLLSRLSHIVGKTDSISNRCVFIDGENLPIKIHKCSFLPNNHVGLGGVNLQSGASKVDFGNCVIAAAAEAVERYSLSMPFSRRRIVLRSAVDSNRCDLLGIEELNRLQGLHSFQFSIAQNRLRPIDANTEFQWIECRRFLNEDLILIPAECVVLNRHKNPYFEVTTNGSALAETYEAATLSAAYELIERHNFLLFWWRKETPQYVDFKSFLKKTNPQLYHTFGPWLDFIRVIYQPGDLNVPTFISIFESSNAVGHPAFCISASANLCPATALYSTLQELGSIINSKLIKISGVNLKNASVASSNFDTRINNFVDNQEFYSYDSNKKKIFFLDLEYRKNIINFENISNQDGSSVVENLNKLKERLSKAGYNPIVVNQTSRDVQELGVHVVRIIDADMIDLNSAHACRRWGKRKLFNKSVKKITDLNHWPHPFP